MVFSFPPSRGVRTASVFALVLAARTADAQSASDSATAQALFDQARTLIAQGHAAEACPKLEESQRLDPGSGTLLNLARCYEQTGRLASAWSKYLETAAAAKVSGNTERESVARQQAEALRPRLSTLTIEVAADAKSISGLEITRDGAQVGAAQWGLPIQADQGDHKIVAKAPGYATWETVTPVKGEGTAITATVPALVAKPASTAIGAPAAAGGEADNASEGGLGTQKIVAIAAAGVGVVGIGIGTAFGVMSMSAHDEAANYCSGSTCSDQRGVDAGNDAYSKGNVSTVAMIVGGVALAAGVTLWFTAPKSSGAPATSVGFGPGTVQMKGAF